MGRMQQAQDAEHPVVPCKVWEHRIVAMDLFYAAAEGSVERVESLLRARADANARDYEQRCAMHVAAGSGGCDVVQCLIAYRAEVNMTDRWGQTPLDTSQQAKQEKVQALLESSGAKNLQKQKGRLQKKAVDDKWEINLMDVQLGKELSRTLKSVIYRATWNEIDVIAKFCLPPTDIPEGTTAEQLEEEMLHEIDLLATVRHPDLVMFLGCCVTQSPIMFITQYMAGGDLEHFYAKRSEHAGGPWAPGTDTVNRWARDVLRALYFLHSCAQPIIHRDLKPLNILLTEDLHDVKINDFGISKTLPKIPQDDLDTYRMTGGVGSWRYMAPEVARHQEYTEKVDIFAFGLILYFMSCGRQPFHNYKDPVDLLREYSKGNEPRPRVADCPAKFRPVMVTAWAEQPADRPSAKELVERMEENYTGAACACIAMSRTGRPFHSRS